MKLNHNNRETPKVALVHRKFSHQKRPVIVLVHGTFAQKKRPGPVKPKAAERDGWWKPENPFTHRIKEILGDIEPEVRAFTWSSENRERDRHEAGQNLLDLMVELETEGRDYHLIGHSHGGSVIWLALQQSMMRRWKSGKNKAQLELPGLKSWSTVGTPFLHYRPSWIGQWYGKAITMLTLILSLMMMFWFGYLEYRSWGHEGNPFEKLLNSPFQSKVEAQPKESLLSKLSKVTGSKTIPIRHEQGMIGAQLQHAGEGLAEMAGRKQIRLKPITFWEWIGTAGEILIAFLVLVAPIFTIYLWIRAQRTEARNVNREIRAQNQAILDFGDRWLGIWCTEDEAINGLRSTTKIPDSEIVPRITIPEKSIFESDRLVRIWQVFIRLFFKPLFNRLVWPATDSYLLSRIAKGAQGHNRKGAILVDVTEGPVLLEGHRFLSLPEKVNQELIDQANEAIGRRGAEILAKTRTGFSQVAWGGSELKAVVHNVANELEGDELVHTSYFEHPFVEEALAMQVRNTQIGKQPKANRKPIEGDEVPAEEKPWRRFGRSLIALLWISLGLLLTGGSILELLILNDSSADTCFAPVSTGILVFITGISLFIYTIRMRRKASKSTKLKSSLAGLLLLIIGGLLWIITWLEVELHPILAFGLVLGLPALSLVTFIKSFKQAKSNPLLSKTLLFCAATTAIIIPWPIGELLPQDIYLSPFLLFAAGLLFAFGALKGDQVKSLWWILLGLGMITWSLIESENGFPVFSISTTLLTFGILIFFNIGKFRHRSTRAIAIGSGLLGGVMIYIATFFGFYATLTGHESKVAGSLSSLLMSGSNFANQFLVSGGFLSAAAICFIISLHRAKTNPLLSRTALFCSLAMLLGAIWGSDEGILAALFFLLLSLCLGFRPLKNKHEAFSPLRAPKPPEQPLIPQDDSPGRWLAAIEENIQAARRKPEIQIFSLPQLGFSNHISIFWTVLFISGLGLASWGFSYLGNTFIFFAGTIGVVFAYFLSFGSAFRSSQGARHRFISVANIHLVSFCLMAGIVGLFGFFIYETFYHTPSASLSRNLVYFPSDEDENSSRLAILEGGSNLSVAIFDEDRGVIDHVSWKSPDNPDKVVSPDMVRVDALRGNMALVEGKRIRLLNLQTERTLIPIDSHEAEVSAVEFMHDGNLLASGSMDGILYLFGTQNGEPAADPFPHRRPILCMDAHPSEPLLAVGLTGGSIVVWNTFRRERVGKERLHREKVKSIGFIADKIVSLDQAGSLKLSQTADDNSGNLIEIPIDEIPLIKQRLTSFQPVHLVANRAGSHLAIIYRHREKEKKVALQIIADETKEIWIPDLVNTDTNASISSLAFDPLGNELALRTDGGQYIFFDLSGEDGSSGSFENFVVQSIAFDSTGRLLACGAADNQVHLWDLASGKKLVGLRGHSGPVNDVAFSQDGKTLASASDDLTIGLWDHQSGELRSRLKGHTGIVTTLDFSPSGNSLVSGAIDNSLRLWDVATGQEKAVWQGHDESVRSVVFSPLGNTVASGSADNSIRIWDVPSGNVIHTLEGHSDDINCLAFSKDGKILISGSDDKSVRFWDATTGRSLSESLSEAIVLDQPVRSLDFSPDGKTLATTSLYGLTRKWHIEFQNPGQDLPLKVLLEKKEQIDDDGNHRSRVVFDPGGQTLAISNGDSIRLIDMATQSLKRELLPIHFSDSNEQLRTRLEEDSIDEIISYPELSSANPIHANQSQMIYRELERKMRGEEKPESVKHPGRAGQLGRLAWQQIEARRFEDALKSCEMSAQLKPLRWVEGNCAIAYLFLGRMDDAIAIHQKNRGLAMDNTPDKQWENAAMENFEALKKFDGLVTSEIDDRFRKIETFLGVSSEE